VPDKGKGAGSGNIARRLTPSTERNVLTRRSGLSETAANEEGLEKGVITHRGLERLGRT
jgi:hypothetical protein